MTSEPDLTIALEEARRTCMVRGCGIAVTAVALMYQWALTTRIARGRGTNAPNARQAAV